MSILFTPLFLYLRKKDNCVAQGIGKLLSNQYLLLYFPVILLLVPQYTLSHFPITHAFIDDWYSWGIYSLLFVIGYILICLKESFWMALNKVRFISLIVGLGSFVILVVLADGKHLSSSSFSWLPIIKVLNMWSWILVIFAWSAKYLNKSSKVVAYRNKAVYPFYILHQTLIIILGYQLMNLPMHYGVKMVVLIGSTFVICWFIYEMIILKVPFLQPIFGVKR